MSRLSAGGQVLVEINKFLVLVSVFASATLAEDWPRFLGPRGDSTSAETNLLATWPETGPPVLFEKKVGTGYSAPSVRAGQLIVHHRVGPEEVVESFDAATGNPKWRFGYPSMFVDPYGYNNGPRCTPLLTEDRCYTFGAEGKLLCLDLKNGRVIWQRDTAKEWRIPEAFFGVGSTPLLEGNVLIVMVGGQPDSGVVGLDPATGKTLWESVGRSNWQGLPMTGWRGERTVEWRDYEKQASYSSPVAATVHGRRTVFCLTRQGLVSLDPTNGKVDFSLWFRAQVDESVNAVNPIVVGSQVFITAAYYKVGSVLLDVAPDRKSFQEKWRSTVLEVHWSTPILHDGHLYAFSGRNEPDGRFRCVEFATGKLKWDRDEAWRRYGEAEPKYGRGSAIFADGRLITLGEGGLLGMFKPNPEKPDEICRAQIAGLKYPCWAAPILSEKRLYIRSEDKLIAFNLQPN